MPLHLTLATVLLAVQVPTHGTIEGVVRGYEQTSGRTLAFATVEAATPGGHRTAAADSLGRYRFEDLPAGLVRLRISHPGHRSARVDVQVPAGGTVSLDVDLERRPILLSPIEVLGDPVTRGRTPGAVDPPLADIEVITLGLSPGLGESGLGEAAATLPGNDPADPTDVLFMRGSTTDLKLVLLDGAPVYTPFHLGGLLSSFDAFALGGAALHVGGAPARYDGGLSYILDLRTRTPRSSSAGRLPLEPELGRIAHCRRGSVSPIHPCLGGAGGGGGVGRGAGECDRSTPFRGRGGPCGALPRSEAGVRGASRHRGVLEGFLRTLAARR